MAVFKSKYTTKSGKAKATQKYSVDFRDHDGVMRRVAAFTDRAATLELERLLKKLVALRMAGAAPDAELTKFLESCPAEVRARLGEWGIIETARVAVGQPLTEHIADWRLTLEAKGDCAAHIKQFVSNVRRLATACGWRALTDISAGSVSRWVSSKREGTMSSGTINHHLRATKSFCGWLVKEHRISENPLSHISLLNAQADRRIERHPYSVDELGRLLTATEAGGIVHGMAGADRALLYRTAVETGFRWSECHSLTRASFNFEATPSVVTIRSEDAKNGKEATLPLRPELAADLKGTHGVVSADGQGFPRHVGGQGRGNDPDRSGDGGHPVAGCER